MSAEEDLELKLNTDVAHADVDAARVGIGCLTESFSWDLWKCWSFTTADEVNGIAAMTV